VLLTQTHPIPDKNINIQINRVMKTRKVTATGIEVIRDKKTVIKKMGHRTIFMITFATVEQAKHEFSLHRQAYGKLI
jgi:hypothetical protein